MLTLRGNPTLMETRRERRGTDRLNKEFDLVYCARGQRGRPILGVGRSLNLSSGGILISSNRELAPGMSIQLAVKWPGVKLGGRPVKLVCEGSVVRSEGARSAIQFETCEFVGRHDAFLMDEPVVAVAGPE